MNLVSSLAAAFEAHTSRSALFIRNTSFTYAQIDSAARRWANYLHSRLGPSISRIGVFGSRSFISYTGTATALFCGAAFVPLNPRFPAARTRRMIELGQLDAILVDPLAARMLPEILAGIVQPPLIVLPEELDQIAAGGEPLLQLPDPPSNQIAYLLFTSGSTGDPKGVPITHGNARAYLDWAHSRYSFRPEDRFSQTFDQTFDLSVHDQFLCWESGAQLFSLTPPELLAPAGFIRRHELTVWFSVPSILAQMRNRKTLVPDAFPSLRWSLFCGEPLPQVSASLWQAAAPASIVENLYGPTELTIACTVHRWDPVHSPALCVNSLTPIGTPFPGLDSLLLDESHQPDLNASSGELAISGAQTSPGYWNDPVRTAAAFLDLPQGRFYRTGDRVSRLPNGEFACLGRVDHQVKVLGFRVELGEIESVLMRFPGVVAAVALGWPVVDGSAQAIVAFIQGDNLDPAALQAHARTSLSDYMVPREFIPVADFPLNANGKTDRLALQQKLL